jgi:hypothetical protein
VISFEPISLSKVRNWFTMVGPLHRQVSPEPDTS